jgi:hypothetical protein
VTKLWTPDEIRRFDGIREKQSDRKPIDFKDRQAGGLTVQAERVRQADG